MSKDYKVIEGPSLNGKTYRFAIRESHTEPYSTAIAAIDTLYFLGEGAGYGATVEYCPTQGWSVWMRWHEPDMAEMLTEGHPTMIEALGAAWEAYESIHASEKP